MAISNRFEPPAPGVDPRQSLGQLSAVVDQLALLADYKSRQDAVVQVAAGTLQRLAPRATGQNVVIPTADGSNFGKEITLLVEATLGFCRVRPITGTIDGASAFTLAAGYISLIVLVSNGQGRWLTQRAAGFPTAGNALTYSGDTLNFTGSTSRVDLGIITGAQGVVDISALQCGGSVTIEEISGNGTISGFTAKTDGFWFNLSVRDLTGSELMTLVHEAAAVTTAIRCPREHDWPLSNSDHLIIYYVQNRWRMCQTYQKPWAIGTDSVSWSGAQSDYTRTDFSVCRIRVVPSGGATTLSGLVRNPQSPNGELVIFENAAASGSGQNLTFLHNAPTGSANDAFFLPSGASVALPPRAALMFVYEDNASDQAWYALHIPGTGGGGGGLTQDQILNLVSFRA